MRCSCGRDETSEERKERRAANIRVAFIMFLVFAVFVLFLLSVARLVGGPLVAMATLGIVFGVMTK